MTPATHDDPLSRHSSNPLEVHTSDSHNQRLHRTLNRAAGREDDDGESDDPISGYDPQQMSGYWQHLQTVRPAMKTRQGGPHGTRSSVRLDRDEDMASDDELALPIPGKVLDQMSVAGGLQHGEDEVQMDYVDYSDEEEEEEEEEETESCSEDEETTLLQKTPEEQLEINTEINELITSVPQIDEDYHLVDRLGTGTFSSVYKGIDLHYHTKWDNTPWHGNHPPESSAYYQSVQKDPKSKVFVAIKRIYVTSSPERIRNEISILNDCRMCRHVSQIITAFRHDDQVVVVMPYQRNTDFREFFQELSMPGIKAYFRCLFRALRDVHARKIIHRDVKPANFLFDPRTGVGTLCDFGLACRMEPGPGHDLCLHTAPTKDSPHGKMKDRSQYDATEVNRLHKQARERCQWPAERIGYPQKDTRPHSKANRAGTRGFRAPEVLLKCGDQSGAIDVWAAGVILLFFLTGKFPLFQSNDDTEALAEVATIIGKKNLERACRTIVTNVPSITMAGIPWREFVDRQNPDLSEPPTPNPNWFPHSTVTFSGSSSPLPPDPDEHRESLEDAYDLLGKLMDYDCCRRITPRDALYHPFLHDEDDEEDDVFFPHPFGEGVCGDKHFIENDEPRVSVRHGNKEVVIALSSGEGIAIGNHPCEFHEDMMEDVCEDDRETSDTIVA